jgi:uncharacterized protein (DUF697 family)
MRRLSLAQTDFGRNAGMTRKDATMEQEATGPGTSDKKDAPVVAVSGEPEMTDARRDELASKLVDRFALYSGGAGLIPVPIVDLVAVGAVQLQMLRRLSEIYGVPFSENSGKSVLASFAGTAVPAVTAAGAASAFKMVPVVGTGVGALTMGAGAAGATYLIGKTFIQHFASGGTLLDFDAGNYAGFLKGHADKLKGHADTLKGHAQTGADKLKGHAQTGAGKLKAGADKLKSVLWPSPPSADSDSIAAAPARPAAESKEAAASS